MWLAGHLGEHGAAHGQATAGWAAFDAVVLLVLAAAAAGYALALWSARGRTPWPLPRTAAWYVGLACAGVALTGPLAEAAHASFTAHMAGHLLLGMLAPLLLVLSAPITLGLQALPVARARSLSRLLRSPFVRVVTYPVTAAVLNAGGLWLLYTTDLYTLMHSSVLIHALVHAHVFLAGYVFTASIVGVDPDPHRAPIRVRAVVLVAFIAAHSILAKWLYANPPAGVETADGQLGSQLMYYGGDAVDVTLIVLLLAGWYRATRPREPVRQAQSASPKSR
ncbi:cytochrome c oxidase assembly protein [Demequina sp. SO4-13]|uniref:cytochrome c oxidase assembly protein n=1 Tax=Demequina sp. SO4-13 TaxID=3401027 RepID=UPI003AF6F955